MPLYSFFCVNKSCNNYDKEQEILSSTVIDENSNEAAERPCPICGNKMEFRVWKGKRNVRINFKPY